MNEYYFDLNDVNEYFNGYRNPFYRLVISRCPECKRDIIKIDEYIKNGLPVWEHYSVKPSSECKLFPEYIPEAIRNDYEEACAILHLSPKASATLSRRCLQGMIRDFWRVKKSRLVDEIDDLKDIIPAAQWNAISALRSLGNIGAHMEKDTNTIIDIDDGEAEKLIKLIELLIQQWYINRHEQEQLYADIVAINDEKQEERKCANKQLVQ